MICSKDFLERLLNDEAQFVDKSNINLPEKFLFLATRVIRTCVAPSLCNLISHDLHEPFLCNFVE